jgi:hypothetical protein
MSVTTADAEAQTTTVAQERRLAVVLVAGAAIWLVLLVAGFFAPGGWTWGMAGPVGHIENYMISLWLVTLIIAPLLAARAPLQRLAAIQVYLLGVLGVVISTFRAETPKLIADAPPLIAAALAIGLVVWAHPQRALLVK